MRGAGSVFGLDGWLTTKSYDGGKKRERGRERKGTTGKEKRSKERREKTNDEMSEQRKSVK